MYITSCYYSKIGFYTDLVDKMIIRQGLYQRFIALQLIYSCIACYTYVLIMCISVVHTDTNGFVGSTFMCKTTMTTTTQCTETENIPVVEFELNFAVVHSVNVICCTCEYRVATKHSHVYQRH